MNASLYKHVRTTTTTTTTRRRGCCTLAAGGWRDGPTDGSEFELVHFEMWVTASHVCLCVRYERSSWVIPQSNASYISQ